MATVALIADERFGVEGAKQSLQVVVTAQNADRRYDVDVTCKFIREDGETVCEARYSASEESPIEPHSLVVVAATAYGLCLGTRYVWESFKIVKQTYNQVTETEKNATTRSERAYHTVNRLPGRGKDFVEAARQVAKGCVTFVVEALISKGAGF